MVRGPGARARGAWLGAAECAGSRRRQQHAVDGERTPGIDADVDVAGRNRQRRLAVVAHGRANRIARGECARGRGDRRPDGGAADAQHRAGLARDGDDSPCRLALGPDAGTGHGVATGTEHRDLGDAARAAFHRTERRQVGDLLGVHDAERDPVGRVSVQWDGGSAAVPLDVADLGAVPEVDGDARRGRGECALGGGEPQRRDLGVLGQVEIERRQWAGAADTGLRRGPRRARVAVGRGGGTTTRIGDVGEPGRGDVVRRREELVERRSRARAQRDLGFDGGRRRDRQGAGERPGLLGGQRQPGVAPDVAALRIGFDARAPSGKLLSEQPPLRLRAVRNRGECGAVDDRDRGGLAAREVEHTDLADPELDARRAVLGAARGDADPVGAAAGQRDGHGLAGRIDLHRRRPGVGLDLEPAYRGTERGRARRHLEQRAVDGGVEVEFEPLASRGLGEAREPAGAGVAVERRCRCRAGGRAAELGRVGRRARHRDVGTRPAALDAGCVGDVVVGDGVAGAAWVVGCAQAGRVAVDAAEIGFAVAGHVGDGDRADGQVCAVCVGREQDGTLCEAAVLGQPLHRFGAALHAGNGVGVDGVRPRGHRRCVLAADAIDLDRRIRRAQVPVRDDVVGQVSFDGLAELGDLLDTGRAVQRLVHEDRPGRA
ncbi:hypothetical protein Rrhod_1928 [Rhodococcus rhodnii LMG 5362]|uniref:Uncharacterized protein n=1 Tax=Rhodococcus rhodnii LMG 5362 TaxID=1273125 RepID=R7WN34_9NOCA|nr:hypothetical protein Rrhod_1928 [Rhodococcus rhodnii LMG 5362]